MSAVVCFLIICAIIYGGITCSFFNSEVSKFLSINIRDIRINKDIVGKTGSGFPPPTVYSDPVDFRNKKVPTSIINFAQFMAIHVYNISLVLMNNDLDAGWLLHAIASELHLDGSIVHNSKTLIVTAALCDAQAKVLRHFPTRKPSLESHSKIKPSLAEINFGVALEGILLAQGPISVENLQVTVSNTKTTLHDGLYNFMRDLRRSSSPKKSHPVGCAEKEGQNAYDCISPIIPKSFTLKIEDTTISSVRENSSNDFSAQLQAFTVSGKFTRNNSQTQYSLPILYMGLHVQSFEIDTNHEKILFVDKLTMDSKLENDTVNLYLKLTTFQKVVIKGCAELWNVSCLGKLSGGQSATININHAKLLLEQFDEIRSCVYENKLANLLLENRHWSTELMVEALWWSLGNSGKEFNKKKVHTKGSPFYMGVSLIKISSYGNATKLDLSVHTLRLEWSPLLTEFISQTLSCIEQYKMPKLQDQVLRSSRKRIRENNGSILVNAKVTDINLFFFNSHEACVLINLTEVSLARNLQLTVLKLCGLQMAFRNESLELVQMTFYLLPYPESPTVNSPLPCDMLIQVKEFLLEMSDDPFEVKLRDNYVLLLDEYNESIERRELLEQKIAQMCQERPLMPARTIESMRAMLEKKSSEIYIQRSKKIAEAGPPRTRLIAWIMSDLEIMAMADPSIHGTENVVKMMKEIDSDSPWPEEGLEFITLWCRAVNMSCLFGHLCGAEQVAPRRAKRDVQIEIGEPFGTHTIQRGMPALKFYHDFDCELDQCSYAFGPCWEPVMAQCNLSFEKISAPSRDPSPLLPFWDKLRLLLHGRLTMIVRQFTVLLHASLDPYNTTEEMELTWNNCGIVWTNAKVMFKGELNVSVRTASRYDDCRLLHFPNLKLTFKLHWICLANPNDHHSVIPCAPDKLPEYSSNQVHDSFRAFRSQNLNIWISFETRAVSGQQPEIDIPNLVLYGSTLRWFENLKLILSGVTRPTRRGPVFNNVRPRKKQLSRHYRKAHLQMSLHKFQVLYWISHALNRGFELNGGRVSFSSEHTLTLYPIDDGLIHRPRADWATMYMNCELNDTEIWLKSILNERADASSESLVNTENPKIVKFYFLSVAKVSYGREAMLASTGTSTEQKHKDSPTHKLVVYDLKGAWTKNNRDVAFALFDSFMKSQKLKKNLSTEVLKGFRKDGGSTTTPLKTRRTDSNISTVTPPPGSSILAAGTPTSSLNKSQQTSHAITMLQQLIAEADHKFHVYSDDLSTQTREQQLQGLQACQDSDVTHYNWFISLVNSQVLLKGCETSGYVILSAAKTEILQRVHRPVWRDRSLVSKTTWVGSLECMQYYATVSAGENDSLLDENIMWLTVDNIQEKDKEATVINELPDIPHLVGSGQSVGGVVSETVGASGPPGLTATQLQRIVSRCKCEFFYVSYGDTSIDPGTLTEVPPVPAEDSLSPWERQDDPVDAFTLMHHDLNVCTNSLQYAMILDIVNNLMLFVEPQRKQASEKLARMRFQLQLSSGEDQKRPILHLQTQVSKVFF
uniref:FMP27/BLTP2/Hobbit GFWDK motif-containing RBG unit domain-containing protein n=1 Tax=Phlebotomus papatasi TaxID=29031 RepID=A0A1B0GN73_PHLPP